MKTVHMDENANKVIEDNFLHANLNLVTQATQKRRLDKINLLQRKTLHEHSDCTSRSSESTRFF
jgi:hypothetical protein